jgi:hypothetical protein
VIDESDGTSTPLVTATIFANFNMARVLVQLGADPLKPDSFGLNSVFWAAWIRNRRIEKLFDGYSNNNDYEQLAKYKTIPQEALFLTLVKPVGLEAFPITESFIRDRMAMFNSAFQLNDDVYSNLGGLRLTELAESVKIFSSCSNIDNLLFNAKIHAVRQCVNQSNQLKPSEIVTLASYTSCNMVCRLIEHIKDGTPLAVKYVETLITLLEKLPIMTSEVYAGVDIINRSNFIIGSEITSNIFLSASTLFNVATTCTPDYATKKNQGTIFIIKPKTASYIGKYALVPSNSEVIFAPHRRFRVANWYRGGDYIVLGQANIREHTYGVKENELNEYMNTQKSMCIELHEI